MPTPDRRHDLLIRNVDPADELALKHASVDAGTNLTEYLRRWMHREAVRVQKPPSAGQLLNFHVTGLTAAQMDKLLDDIIDAVVQAGGELGGGYADEPPNT